MTEPRIDSYVSINPAGKGKIQISYNYMVKIKREEDGLISCFIPSFDIYYTAPSEQEIVPKSQRLTRSLILYFDHNRKTALRSFVLHLHKLGFKAPNDTMTVKNFINNKVVKTKFKSDKTEAPTGFVPSETIIEESELEFAI